MENSRVEKFKEYRKSLQGENYKKPQQEKNDFENMETGKLPLDFVIQDSEQEEKPNFNDWIERNWTIIKVVAIVVGLCALIVAIILLAIDIGRA